jgi:hypothetical protein
MTRSISKPFGFSFAAVMLNLLLIVPAAAQTGATTVSGTVSDAQGGVVAGATVRLVNAEKGFSRSAVTNGEGAYTFSVVPPDTYSIEVEANGFKKLVVSNVIALVDKPTTANARLEAGNISEVVNVSGGDLASLINTQDASLGNNFVSRQILQLPLEGRNVADLLSLQPGVTQTGEVTGSRSDQANITLDGVDVNDQQNGTAFSPVIRVTPDSVDEFRVTTTNADAARGRSSGAQISLSTKGGDNEWRGALYEYHRNTVTTANDYFNNLNGVPRPKLIRNLFGGRLGGPVVKDRFFFFYNYEGLRESRETPVTNLVPLASLGQGTVKFPDANGNLVTLTAAQINALTTNGQPGGTAVVNVNPASLAVLADAAQKYPANDFTVGDGFNTAGFRFNAKIPQEQNTHTSRIDWNITRDDSHKLSFRSTFQKDFAIGASQFPDTPGTRRDNKPFNISPAYNWVISNDKINVFRYGWTRQKFEDTGDTNNDTITFRGVFAPFNFAYPFARQTDTHNFTDDFSWTKGSHLFQFGGNIRIVRNQRSDESVIHEVAVVNRSWYAGSGNVLTNPILNTTNPATGARYTILGSAVVNVRDAMAAVFGRIPDLTFNTNFTTGGQPLAPGEPVVRRFATEEYDLYLQDSWRITPSLNAVLGLRYGLSRPVYEQQGYQSKPNISLTEYLRRRVEASAAGQNYGDVASEALTVELAGPANGKGPVYPWDKNNFQPSVGLAWSPNFENGFLNKLFGSNNKSVFRGGFRITNDYFGQALAVNFDANNTLGFASQLQLPANTYNVSTNPAPLFTGFNQSIRSLPLPPGFTLPTSISFPQQQPLDDGRRIEGSLDDNLVSPINYQWNFTFGREFPKGIYVEASYVGRLARNLLASRDVMTPNNLRDPVSGQTWYEAAGILEDLRRRRVPVSQIPNIPFFQNVYAPGSIDALLFGTGLTNTQAAYGFMATGDTPGCESNNPLTFGCYEFGNDWTFMQDIFDQNLRPVFFNRQYGALSAFGTIAGSDYHGGTLSIRQRFKGLQWDFNYTLAKSMDDASGTQVSGVFGQGFILNALRPEDNRSVSDFDVRHIINMNSIWNIPIGKDRYFGGGMNKYLDAVVGGWQLSSIFRYNTGYPISGVSANFVDIGGWPTNWNSRSFVVRLNDVQTSPTKNGPGGVPNLFSNPTTAYQSFRTAAPGETGDRNAFRYPGYIVLDLGLAKSWGTPWNENHKVQLRVDTFNLTNTQRFTGANTVFGLDPFKETPDPTFGNFLGIQGTPRVIQFAIRYDF